VLLATATSLLTPDRVQAQAQTSLLSLQVAYSTRKAVAKPTGELAARLDSVDAAFTVANRAGNMGEARRQLAKGTALLAGRAWTDSADLSTSLLLRSDRVVIDSRQPYTLRIEQQYKPTVALGKSTSARVLLSKTAQGGARTEIGKFDVTSTDLQAKPFSMKLDLDNVADGRYTVVVELVDAMRVVGTATLPVSLRKGIDASVARLETEANTAPEPLRAEILFPVDRMRHINQGQLELRMLDSDKDFAIADSVVAAVKQKKDPFAGRTGDFKRHYALAGANEILPYHLYVPTNYTATAGAPLIIALHGLGATEDSFFDSYGKALPQLAEQGGYILAGALGYRVDGGYGWGVGTPPSDTAARRSSELSELDVMQVLEQVRKQYNIDPKRIYLMGHSLGAIGTWKIAAKYPDVWAALGLFAGQGQPTSAGQLKNIPEFVVHGDADPTVNVRGSRTMVAALKALNTEVVYIEVPGGNHGSVVQPNLAGMVEFFGKHKKP
ncbi:MAG: PHB depolymerase family esterase, partial [Gemmatimonadaceae bacterium]